MTNTKEKIEKIVAEVLGLDENTLEFNANFKDDLGVDSLDMVALAEVVEKQFSITIPDEDIERIQTVQQLVNYVNKATRLPQKSSAHSLSVIPS